MEKETGRNEPCPCGSGRKFKRCHGADPVTEAPVEAVAPPTGEAPAPGGMPGFDPSKLDPKAMNQVAQAMRRLPRGQVQRLQSLVQKAMAGKDVSREAAELEGALPPDFQKLMMSLAPQMMGGMPAPAEAPEMTEEEARRIVAEAAQRGDVAIDRAEKLLGGAKPADVVAEAAAKDAQKSKGGWKSFFGKK